LFARSSAGASRSVRSTRGREFVAKPPGCCRPASPLETSRSIHRTATTIRVQQPARPAHLQLPHKRSENSLIATGLADCEPRPPTGLTA
jgi:hypothetical protein